MLCLHKSIHLLFAPRLHLAPRSQIRTERCGHSTARPCEVRHCSLFLDRCSVRLLSLLFQLPDRRFVRRDAVSLVLERVRCYVADSALINVSAHWWFFHSSSSIFCGFRERGRDASVRTCNTRYGFTRVNENVSCSLLFFIELSYLPVTRQVAKIQSFHDARYDVAPSSFIKARSLCILSSSSP